MLDRLDEEGAVLEARPPRLLEHVVDQRRDGRDLAVLLADERNPLSRLGRREGEGGRLAREQSAPGERNLPRNCLLLTAHVSESGERADYTRCGTKAKGGRCAVR